MPMSFPDMKSLKNRAMQRGFRQPIGGESEDNYRNAFADYMVNVDMVESMEIRSGKGWDEMDPVALQIETINLIHKKTNPSRNYMGYEYMDGRTSR